MGKIILGIPGPWQDAAELEHAIQSADDGYRLIAGELTAPENLERFQLEFVEHDPELRSAFQAANRRSLTETDLNLLHSHHLTVYLIGPGGSFDTARGMMFAAGELVKAGGYAVKVETAGVAHSGRDWLDLCNRITTHIGVLYIAYVALVNRADDICSCGMHNLGMRDAIMRRHNDLPQPGAILRDFLLSLIHEPALSFDADTIFSNADGFRYRVTAESCLGYPPGDLYHNPYGMWRLAPV